MKYFFVLAFTFSLLALAPLVEAQTNTGNTCNPNAVSTCPTGYICQATGGGANAGICVQSSPTNTGTPPATTGQSITLLNPLNSGTSLPVLLDEILQFVVKIGSVVIVLMVIYVGFKFVMARGEPDAIIEARQALLWTVVGALILLGAEAIAKAIEATAQAL